MKVLLDECTPRILKHKLSGVSVSTVQELGWKGIKNGKLLGLAETRFDVLITTDQYLRSQQNLSTRRLAVVLVPSNRVTIVVSLIPVIEEAL